MKKLTTDSGRFYKRDFDNGKTLFYPSATTILSVMPTKSYLKEYFLSKTKAEVNEILEQAGLQGSKIHHAIELLFLGETLTPSGIKKKQIEKTCIIEDDEFGDAKLIKYLKKRFTEKEDKMMRGFLLWFDLYKPKTIASECKVFSDKYKYAGTVDWIGFITDQKTGEKFCCMIDWKTGKSLYESYDYQVAAYIKAYNEEHGTEIDKAFLLQLGVNKCGYKMKEIKDIEDSFKKFLHFKKTWDITNGTSYLENGPKQYEFLSKYEL